MGKKVDLKSVTILGQMFDEEGNVFTVTRDVTEKSLQYGISIVRAKHSKNEKYVKQDMMLLNPDKLEKFCKYIMQMSKFVKDWRDINVIECDCHSEILVYRYFPEEDDFCISYFDNYFLSKWGSWKYRDNICIKSREAEKFAIRILSVIDSDKRRKADDESRRESKGDN